MNLQPLDDRLVIEPLTAEDKTPGGILLPDTAKKKPHRGKVLAVGPGRRIDGQRTRAALAVAVGDLVLYGPWSGSEVETDGKELRIMAESDILAKVAT